jgi:hypothetical protein
MALNDAFPDAQYASFIDANGHSIWDNDRGSDYQFGLVWSGPFDVANAATQSSALDALIAAATITPPASASNPSALAFRFLTVPRAKRPARKSHQFA